MTQALKALLETIRENPDLENLEQLKDKLREKLSNIDIDRVLQANLFTILSSITLGDLIPILLESK